MTQTIAYRCTPDAIRAVVMPDKMGAYALGDMEDGAFVIKYVRRSDRSLLNRLISHNYLYCFGYFIFQYTATVKEAFELESRWWHICRMVHMPLVNRIHPDSPAGMGLCCPYCNFGHTLSRFLYKTGNP